MSSLYTECPYTYIEYTSAKYRARQTRAFGVIRRSRTSDSGLYFSPTIGILHNGKRVDVINIFGKNVYHYRNVHSVEKCKSCKWALRQFLGKCYVRYDYEEYTNVQK